MQDDVGLMLGLFINCGSPVVAVGFFAQGSALRNVECVARDMRDFVVARSVHFSGQARSSLGHFVEFMSPKSHRAGLDRSRVKPGNRC